MRELDEYDVLAAFVAICFVVPTFGISFLMIPVLSWIFRKANGDTA